ncbi:hypothetical protein HUW52_19285 [Pseudomonas sp. 43A]|uniref:hypothetical protein n=1 Tax=unclassified Pseudomonas TaxID=196821 RepID=UPI0015877263|nr:MULTISPECIES: hypothetical protein [unclassified Pseudomonas]QKV64940.1 hypothetical protein HUW52_19285 [Pseudomonas sp. 43A]QMW12606.1 hypothetical protein H3303_13415 [Pseudomonas sp. 29A]
MGLSKIDIEESIQIAKMLSSRIDFKKDLPAMVFSDVGLEYYFFERPLLSFADVLNELCCLNYQVFSAKVFVLFGNPHSGACYLLDGQDVEEDIGNLSAGFRDFFKGTVDYPMVIGNLDGDWLAFESACEEYGVIALNSAGSSHREFSECLRCNLISSEEFQSLKGNHEVLDKIIDAFNEYF